MVREKAVPSVRLIMVSFLGADDANKTLLLWDADDSDLDTSTALQVLDVRWRLMPSPCGQTSLLEQVIVEAFDKDYGRLPVI